MRVRRSEDDQHPMRAMITRLPMRTGYGVESVEVDEPAEAEAETPSAGDAEPGFICVWGHGPEWADLQGQLGVVGSGVVLR